MIRWQQTHSGVFAAVMLAISILAFYLVIALPWQVPEIIAGAFYFIPAALFVAVVDHGHLDTTWPYRMLRWLASWILTVVWMLVGLSMVGTLHGANFSIGQTGPEIWSTLWPMFIAGAFLSWLGIIIIRWMERRPDPFGPRMRSTPLTKSIRRDTRVIGKQVYFLRGPATVSPKFGGARRQC